MRLLPLSVALLATGYSAASSSAPAPAPTTSFFALGQGDGWALEIVGDRLIFNGEHGSLQIAEPHSGEQVEERDLVYRSPRLEVRVSPGLCADGTRRYAAIVRLVADGKPLFGCGGALLPPANLVGTLFSVSHINGSAVADATRTELRFAEQKVTGSVGCNRFSGSFSLVEGTLTTGPIAITRIACHDPEETQEARFLLLLSKPVSIGHAADGAMILIGEGGASARLVQRP